MGSGSRRRRARAARAVAADPDFAPAGVGLALVGLALDVRVGSDWHIRWYRGSNGLGWSSGSDPPPPRLAPRRPFHRGAAMGDQLARAGELLRPRRPKKSALEPRRTGACHAA
jgi:hypothetical protein